MTRSLPSLVLVLLLGGCTGGGGLTLANGTKSTLKIEGLPSGDTVLIDPGSLHHVRNVSSSLDLKASATVGGESHSARFGVLAPGSESVWSIGGTTCFAEGNFSEYYSLPVDVPATVQLVGLLKEGETTYTSPGSVSAAPGQRLPSSQSGDPVHAIVRLPCQATRSEPIARRQTPRGRSRAFSSLSQKFTNCKTEF